MKRKTRKAILITILSVLCVAMIAGIAVVTSVLIGDGCDMPVKGNSTNGSSGSSVGDGDGWTDFH